MSSASDISSASGINSASEINLMLKEISDEEAEISIETDAETATDFKEKADLVKKLARADNAAALII